MHKFKRAVGLVMLAIWALATIHCELEHVPGLQFLACCQHPGSPAHQDNDCDQDACAVVETGFYKTDEQPVLVAKPLYLLNVPLPLVDPVLEVDSPGVHFVPSTPPELIPIWHFSFRAARPPRAPSFLS